YVPVAAMAELDGLPPDLVLPPVDIPPLPHAARLRCWRLHLGPRARDLEPAIGEVARRFRYEPRTIAAICAGLPAGPLTAETLAAAARAQVPLDTGDLAQAVTPRFRDEELVLPPAQRRQVEEIHNAMRRLAEVHYGWGTARAWSEGGISVLFAGPSGTGKTMAAEVLAARLAMPMYRIDLSQVVNKYIGETEKNLKRLFDMADVADAILFFDEADALFGRRTEVRDAHDRYANLEVSYLLERMERFKGLAILATNRRKDLDEAFLRRLRYIVEFPPPDVPQRRAIWECVIPPEVDAGDLDLDFLARQFQLTGGSIRSVVFNACLQSAAGPGDDARRLAMPEVLVAVKRECEKLGRGVSPEQFGPWLAAVEALRDG
ncbi:MAG: ATP-binding protein, partial [Rhodospirillaceae bacterium]|nr:ATP-binding protein [Rhodospirillaceae bacterium]